MTRTTTLELFKESMKFSVAHFTIFSATERELLHGHNYNVYVALTCKVADEGLTFDYRFYKRKILDLCKSLSQHLLLPEFSPHLKLSHEAPYIVATFNQTRMPFLESDVIVLPLKNITVEELSFWFVEQLIADKKQIQEHHIEKVTVRVFTSPGQSGSYTWEAA